MLSSNTFENTLLGLENQGYQAFRELSGLSVRYPSYTLHFKHIQNSPGASPASSCKMDIPAEQLPLPPWVGTSPARITAAEDYLLRSFNEGWHGMPGKTVALEAAAPFSPFPCRNRFLNETLYTFPTSPFL